MSDGADDEGTRRLAPWSTAAAEHHGKRFQNHLAEYDRDAGTVWLVVSYPIRGVDAIAVMLREFVFLLALLLRVDRPAGLKILREHVPAARWREIFGGEDPDVGNWLLGCRVMLCPDWEFITGDGSSWQWLQMTREGTEMEAFEDTKLWLWGRLLTIRGNQILALGASPHAPNTNPRGVELQLERILADTPDVPLALFFRSYGSVRMDSMSFRKLVDFLIVHRLYQRTKRNRERNPGLARHQSYLGPCFDVIECFFEGWWTPLESQSLGYVISLMSDCDIKIRQLSLIDDEDYDTPEGCRTVIAKCLSMLLGNEHFRVLRLSTLMLLQNWVCVMSALHSGSCPAVELEVLIEDPLDEETPGVETGIFTCKWQWLVFALTDRRSRHHIRNLKVVGHDEALFEADPWEAGALMSDLPMELFGASLNQQTFEVVDVRPDASVWLDPEDESTTGVVSEDESTTGVALVDICQCATNLMVISSEEEMVSVLLPFWGQAWIDISDIVDRRVVSSFTHPGTLAHVAFRYVYDESAPCFLDTVKAIGQTVRQMELQSFGSSNTRDEMTVSILRACPNLEELTIDQDVLSSLDALAPVYESDNCQIRSLVVKSPILQHSRGFVQGLQTPSHPFSKIIRDLELHFVNALNGEDFFHILETNHHLVRLVGKTTCQGWYNQHKQRFISTNGKAVPVRRGPMPLREKLAFLSVIRTMSADSGPVQNLDSNVIAQIFRFGAMCCVRVASLEYDPEALPRLGVRR